MLMSHFYTKFYSVCGKTRHPHASKWIICKMSGFSAWCYLVCGKTWHFVNDLKTSYLFGLSLTIGSYFPNFRGHTIAICSQSETLCRTSPGRKRSLGGDKRGKPFEGWNQYHRLVGCTVGKYAKLSVFKQWSSLVLRAQCLEGFFWGCQQWTKWN